MQGKKEYARKIIQQFSVEWASPQNKFLSQVKISITLSLFIRFYQAVLWFKRTKKQFGGYHQRSKIDFALQYAVGYFVFLGYDIDEGLPWYSTISRTWQLFPASVFEAVFTEALVMCIDKGMVSGHTQAIDSLWSILKAFFRPQIRPIQLIWLPLLKPCFKKQKLL